MTITNYEWRLRRLVRIGERFVVHARNRIIPVAAEAAAYFFKEEIIFLVTTDGQRHISDYHTLEELEHVLDPARFFRANR